MEVFKTLPGAHGFVVVQYGPVASRGDHVVPKMMDNSPNSVYTVGVLAVALKGGVVCFRAPLAVRGCENSLYFTVLGDTYPSKTQAKQVLICSNAVKLNGFCSFFL